MAAEAVYGRPLAEWQATGTASVAYPQQQGRVLRVPDVDAVLCSSPPPESDQWGTCSLSVSRRTGVLIGFDRGYDPERLSVVFELQPGNYYGVLGIARGDPRLWGPNTGPGEPEDGESYTGPVRGRLSADVDGRPYWVGCWRYRDRSPFPYGCTLAMDLGRNGSAYADFETEEPEGDGVYAPDRTEMDRLARMISAIRASFDGKD
ncbi:hypothetical protein GCM10007301_05470 [Azorhizobium oxalatiphilum]|uniref:Uncharacterized protein n=1 Tax=Azorhizobium oxalatiphilum TaxID=980631 RepID=A0A917F560_9HYPH|nr:hypothetical protein GCM10007301_05470 [Azorhizobium oxalatiphilum]